jgi:hypothetical protein
MTPASLFLLALLLVTLLVDYAKLRRRAVRIVWLELVIFAAGGVLVAYPPLSTRLAAWVGIGRGADLVLYLTTIWLVRESILSRFARWEEAERFTQLVRDGALRDRHRRSELP